MYIPKTFQNKNLSQMHQLIEQFNFATVITASNDVVHTTHVPIMLNRNHGQYGTLTWHMAKQNPHAKAIELGKKTLCIFHGPHSYIAPGWYQDIPNVPTWNYAVVHAHGIPSSVSYEQLSADLSHMVDYHESLLQDELPYIIPDDHKAKLMQHIIGFKMEILQLEGNFKLGQNNDEANQESVLQGLRRQKNYEAKSMAEFMESVGTT